jgi:hypothetical protein
MFLWKKPLYPPNILYSRHTFIWITPVFLSRMVDLDTITGSNPDFHKAADAVFGGYGLVLEHMGYCLTGGTSYVGLITDPCAGIEIENESDLAKPCILVELSREGDWGSITETDRMIADFLLPDTVNGYRVYVTAGFIDKANNTHQNYK